MPLDNYCYTKVCKTLSLLFLCTYRFLQIVALPSSIFLINTYIMLLILLVFAKLLSILNKNEKFVGTNYYCYDK